MFIHSPSPLTPETRTGGRGHAHLSMTTAPSWLCSHPSSIQLSALHDWREVGEPAGWSGRDAGRIGHFGQGRGGRWSIRESQCPPCLRWKKLLISLVERSPGWGHCPFHPPLCCQQTETRYFWLSALYDSGTLRTSPACLERSQHSAPHLSWGPRWLVLPTLATNLSLKCCHRETR